MRKQFCGLSLILLAAGALHAQNQKEMTLQLQRDVALLQEQLRTMQRSQDEKFTILTERLGTTLDQVNRMNSTLAVTQSNLNTKLSEIEKQVSAPLSVVGSKVESMSDQFLGLSNTIADLNSRIGKLDAKVVELQKMVQVMQQPVVAPPPAGGTAPPGGGDAGAGGGSASANVPSPTKTYNDAQRDFSAGSYDLALQGFQEYVKNYATTQMAADAQFYIGEIHSRRENFDLAIKEYDKVIDNYSDSSRVANARYMKGIALMKLGRRSDAKKEFQTVVDKYPGSELTPRAKQYLKALGVNTSRAPAPVTKKAVRRK